MRGEIFIVNKKYSTGKIVFDADRESSIIEFQENRRG